MRGLDREEYPPETLQRLLRGVTFFKDLLSKDPEQFELLMSVTRFTAADKDEVILHKGEPANVLYFLLKGELSVLQSDISHNALNLITAGEILGVMAMVLNSTRSASLKVNGRTALLAGIDYNHFHDLHDHSMFSLETKLSFFRMLNANIRWNLEKNRFANPDHPLVSELRRVPLITKPRGTQEELEALHTQAHALAQLLCDWNETGAIAER
ncbi:MAG: cyclic nucleotide-binding protein [Oceanospirillaceae bacterium]|nr:cyclic nucleotide-binding protein [Oceanospirillaceae bacterium]